MEGGNTTGGSEPPECPKGGGRASRWSEAHRLESLSSDVACLVGVADLGMDFSQACQAESPG